MPTGKKKTDLWLENLPPLLPEILNYKHYGEFITNMSGFRRSITPIEVGQAMVKQWSYLLKKDGENNMKKNNEVTIDYWRCKRMRLTVS